MNVITEYMNYKKITLTESEIEIAKANKNMPVKKLARQMGIGYTKLRVNMVLMGLIEIPKEKEPRLYSFEKQDGTFDEVAFGKLYAY